MDIKHLLCTPSEPYPIGKSKDLGTRPLIGDQHRPETLEMYSQPAVVYDSMYGTRDADYYCSWSQYRQPASPTSDTISTRSNNSIGRTSRSSSVSSTESVYLNPSFPQPTSAFTPSDWMSPSRSQNGFSTSQSSPGNDPHYFSGSLNTSGSVYAPSTPKTPSRRMRSTSSPGTTPIQTRLAWTPLEDELLQKGYDEGLSWAMISAAYLPHRSRGCCWGRFKTLQSKNIIDPKRQNARLFRRPWKTMNATHSKQNSPFSP